MLVRQHYEFVIAGNNGVFSFAESNTVLLANLATILKTSRSTHTSSRGTPTVVPSPPPEAICLASLQPNVKERFWEHASTYEPGHDAQFYYDKLKGKFDGGQNNRNNYSLSLAGTNPIVCFIKGGNKSFKIPMNNENFRNLYLEFHNCKFRCDEWILKVENGEFNSVDYKTMATSV